MPDMPAQLQPRSGGATGTIEVNERVSGSCWEFGFTDEATVWLPTGSDFRAIGDQNACRQFQNFNWSKDAQGLVSNATSIPVKKQI